MNFRAFRTIPYFTFLFLGATVFTACGDDDSFSPVSKNRGYDYAYTTAKDLSKTPCNDMREGREAVIGRNKDSYVCKFDYQDSVYIWVGYDDTLTAVGKEFVRAESSSSSDDENPLTSSGQDYSSSSRQKVSDTPRLTEKGEQFNPDINYGTMTDSRDGKKYKTVVVNGQTWMAENLNYAGNEYGDAFCYNDEEEFCELYGRLYTREAAMNSPECTSESKCNLGTSPIQGICPDGWHIPTYEETEILIKYIGTNEADWISKKGWESEFLSDSTKDTYGLSFIPSGIHESKGFRSLDTASCMWVYLPNGAQRYLLINVKSNDLLLYDYSSYVSIGVRCVKGKANPVSSSSYSSSSYSSSYSSSSSSAKSSSSVSSSSMSSSSLNWEELKPRLTVKGEQFNPNINYGTMTDPRDSKTYRTVSVEGTIWMAENLNYDGNEIGKSRCFNNDEEICNLYGRFYSRDAAMNDSRCAYQSSCNLGNGPIQGICPDGWHIPTYSETQVLVTLAGKKARPLMSTIGWGTEDSLYINPGVDTYGLSFVGTGDYDTKHNFDEIGEYSYTWVYYQSSDMYYLLIRGKDNEAFINNFDGYETYFSVRCVKGDGAPASSSSAKSSSSSVSSSSSSSSSTPPSSSSVKSSSSFDRSVLFNPSISYGTMTDTRDGKTYRTIYYAGSTWMAENLNYADSSKNPILEGNSRCYGDDPNNCEVFGRLYAYPAAMDDDRCEYTISCNLGSGKVQGVCPDGWHIPTKNEADVLVSHIGQNGGNAAMSSYGWEASYSGTNTNGLSFTGAGVLSESFSGKGTYTSLWVYNASSTGFPYFLMIHGSGHTAVLNEGSTKPFHSVRCVKD